MERKTHCIAKTSREIEMADFFPHTAEIIGTHDCQYERLFQMIHIRPKQAQDDEMNRKPNPLRKRKKDLQCSNMKFTNVSNPIIHSIDPFSAPHAQG
jgi:hypothetical protein